jgi:hypothetical protein
MSGCPLTPPTDGARPVVWMIQRPAVFPSALLSGLPFRTASRKSASFASEISWKSVISRNLKTTNTRKNLALFARFFGTGSAFPSSLTTDNCPLLMSGPSIFSISPIRAIRSDISSVLPDLDQVEWDPA